jgi:hypothetical protein
MDVTGRILLQEKFENKEVIKLHLPGPAGLYFIHVKNDRVEEAVVKVVKE